MDDELDEIRRRKLVDLQRGAQDRVSQEQYAQQVNAQKQTILRQILTPEARERLGRIELAYPDLTQSIEDQLIQLAQSGRVNQIIDDATLQQILRKIIPKKHEIKIERR